jgi:prefoldin subunit 5
MAIERAELEALKEYLKEYFDTVLSGIRKDLRQIYEQGNENSRVIRTIESNTSVAITGINKDIERLHGENRELKNRLKEIENKYKTIDNDLLTTMERVDIIRLFLKWILATCGFILITFIWQIIVSGGIAGLVR